ncbi:MAG: ATP-binding protein [Steroidobacteraceae bacterium]
MPSHVLVISGLPATGKTTAARRLSNVLSWPLLAKDDFKERLFDTVGSSDALTSRRLSLASYALMFDVARQLADAGVHFVLEGNFRWAETGREFESLYERVQFTQLWCTAPSGVLIERLRQRAHGASRHPGHRDAENFATLVAELAHAPSALPLPGTTLTFDSVCGNASCLDDLLEKLQGSR